MGARNAILRERFSSISYLSLVAHQTNAVKPCACLSGGFSGRRGRGRRISRRTGGLGRWGV